VIHRGQIPVEIAERKIGQKYSGIFLPSTPKTPQENRNKLNRILFTIPFFLESSNCTKINVDFMQKQLLEN
jgi:hypothetical protein